MANSATLTKKKLKNFVKSHGFFQSMSFTTDKNAPSHLAGMVPEGATYFEGVASTGDKNRNGYIIRASAWSPAIAEFMKNPIILLQHDAEKPIGLCLHAEVVGNELRVAGFIYDDMTGSAFGRGLLKALSTGHITEEVEFENEKTKQILTKDEYIGKREKGEIGWGDPNWVLVVTALQWVEFSLIAIGSNRSSFVTAKNAIEAYLKTGSLSENSLKPYATNEAGDAIPEEEDEEESDGGSIPAETEEGKPAQAAENAEQAASTDSSEDPNGSPESPEKAGESPADASAASETPAGGAEGEGANPEGGTVESPAGGGETPSQPQENKVVISVADRQKLEGMAETLRNLLESTIADTVPQAPVPAVAKNEAVEVTPPAPKATEEGKQTEGDAGTAPAAPEPEATPAPAAEGTADSEGNALKKQFAELPEAMRNLIQSLAKTVQENELEIASLKSELAAIKGKTLQRKVLAVTPFAAEASPSKNEGGTDAAAPVADKPKGTPLLNYLCKNGLRIPYEA